MEVDVLHATHCNKDIISVNCSPSLNAFISFSVGALLTQPLSLRERERVHISTTLAETTGFFSTAFQYQVTAHDALKQREFKVKAAELTPPLRLMKSLLVISGLHADEGTHPPESMQLDPNTVPHEADVRCQ